MTLLSALFGIAADRLLTHLHEYRQYAPLFRYVAWMRARFNGPPWDGPVGLLLTLLPLWLLTLLLQLWVSDWLLGLAGLLFYVAVLVYCLGPRDLASDVDTWCEVSDSSDEVLRNRAAARLLPGQSQQGATSAAADMVAAVLVEANDRLFGVLFWFVLLGPLGAVMYRSVALLYQQRQTQDEFADSLSWWYAVLLWLPARLVALGFALAGHFDLALEGWRRAQQERPQGVTGSERVLAMTGSGALGLDTGADDRVAPVRAAMRLVWRALAVWLVVLSLLVLAGWADAKQAA
jgi:membrane protein required for beta-lactamase induction